MRTRSLLMLVGSGFALLGTGPAHASYNVCGMGMRSSDCGEVASTYVWPADSQPTFGLGCVGYPSPGDGGYRPPPTVYAPGGAGQLFKIEAGGQEVVGGSFVDLHVTCNVACVPDGGGTSCSPSSLVRYVGPLLPGQKHKITWTNGQTRDPPSPWVEFMVSASGAIDAAVSGDGSGGVDTAAAIGGPLEVGAAAEVQAADVAAAAAEVQAADVVAAAGDGAGTGSATSGCSCALASRRPPTCAAQTLLALAALGLRRRGARVP
jgi:hypothetical protein